MARKAEKEKTPEEIIEEVRKLVNGMRMISLDELRKAGIVVQLNKEGKIKKVRVEKVLTYTEKEEKPQVEAPSQEVAQEETPQRNNNRRVRRNNK